MQIRSLFQDQRWVSFWYAPRASDLNSTINVLKQHKDAVTSVMLYCGHAVDNSGNFVGEVSDICVGQNGIVPALRKLGIGVEFVVNDGCQNATAHKIFMANKTTVGTLTSIAKKYNLTGWNLDLEPQKVYVLFFFLSFFHFTHSPCMHSF